MNTIRNKIKSWLVGHLVETQATLIILIFIISILSGLTEKTDVMMISLLVFIGTEFLVISIGYLERILKKVGDSKKSDVEVIINNKLEWIDFTKNAKHDVFLSGPTLGSLNNDRRVFYNIPQEVKLKFLVHDFEVKETIKAYCYVCKPKDNIDQLTIKHQVFKSFISNDLKDFDNVEIRVTKTPLHIIYMGCDIFKHSNNTKIRAQHFLRKYVDRSSDDKLIFSAEYGTSLYEVYEKQLKALWKEAYPLEW